MDRQCSTADMELLLGENLKNLRLLRNVGQLELAQQAGVSRNALQKLEGGKGSTIKTLVLVLRALDHSDWINSLAPEVSINPLDLVRLPAGRQRATGSRGRRSKL